MTQETGEVCVNCHKLAKTFRFKVLLVTRTKTTTYAMQMCADCARQLADILTAVSDMKPEVFDASEGSGSAQASGQGGASNSP